MADYRMPVWDWRSPPGTPAPQLTDEHRQHFLVHLAELDVSAACPLCTRTSWIVRLKTLPTINPPIAMQAWAAAGEVHRICGHCGHIQAFVAFPEWLGDEP